ncbi:CxxC-x17-CxxC domain-containing protein [Patescibacteria group bacterium]
MNNFKQGNRFGGGKFSRKNSGKRDFGGRSQMHDAICSNCNKKCQVPFRPTGEKPVFCSDCFDKERGSTNERNFGRNDRGKSRSEERRMYQAVCSQCGNKCEIPFLPTGSKAVYCKNCFEGGASTADRRHNESRHDHKKPRRFADSKNTESYKEQFEMLNAKLDKLVTLLTPTTSKQVPARKKAIAPKSKKTRIKSVKKATASKKAKRK